MIADVYRHSTWSQSDGIADEALQKWPADIGFDGDELWIDAIRQYLKGNVERGLVDFKQGIEDISKKPYRTQTVLASI